jgi:16S rRNA (uracil1498-N3)-methyltransferase
MADRYFVETPIAGPRAVLTGQEAHHLLHVMRAQPGVEVVLFDGGGCEFPARVVETSRAAVELEVLSREEIDRELARAVTLGVALPKGDRQKWLVEKCVELGARRVVPLMTARGVARPNDKALDRLRRSVIEASKQFGRNRLMEIAEPIRWSAFVQSGAPGTARLIAHPGGDAAARESLATDGDVYFAVGPEGGFTGEEAALARDAGWRAVGLGPRILRVETAAVLLAALAGAR